MYAMIYANTGSTHLRKLLTLNNNLLRILQNKPYHSPTKDLYFKFNTLPIPDLHVQQILLFVHTFIHRKKLFTNLNVFADYFVLDINVHSHITRGNNDLHVNAVNKNYGKK